MSRWLRSIPTLRLKTLIGGALIVAGALTVVIVLMRDRIRLYADGERTRASILGIIPQGTRGSLAQQILENDGFRCVFRDALLNAESKVTAPGLLCSKQKWAPTVIVGYHEWLVTLWVVDGIVADVRVVYGVTAW